ncbi:exodeoxyribonuclease VII large subunit [Vibrio sp. SS-MA-C1-2]|uniref:exodeoxyribonuclease VII large subunit n=1 Tax=Vibrio sp. SS-MA-C1-2 TaxID=2908646 RepID=UPI001F2B26E2|nr:exodeoxyribonuclease VII large subunit [Vibrio sp. SS-MA-C1-2]UJF20066.1 exodeoxyribonuclease VII large subunit [Vibrio sp. SS-MA-C1-2]
MNSHTNDNIYTVSRLNAEVRSLLENEMGVVWLLGEISNLSIPVSGHWYFSLKDARAQVKCAMFKGNNRRVTFRPEHGNQVLVRARLSLYEPRGDYQLIIDSMQPAGDGLLQQQFDQLKMQLAGEGLFSEQRKKTLPLHPKSVGIITSKTGAALFDILNVLKRRDPGLNVIIYPTLVQGESAAIQIAQAIGCANAREECDVLIVGRGGGSLEDLWCFNQEIVARTIAASLIPIISAVGHEVDVTIADFVADVRAPTPSAAAELVSRDLSQQHEKINQLRSQLIYSWRHFSQQNNQQIKQLQYGLEKQHPQQKLQQQQQYFDDLNQRLRNYAPKMIQQLKHDYREIEYRLNNTNPQQSIQDHTKHIESLSRQLKTLISHRLEINKTNLAAQADKLNTVSPLATLARGYTITRNEQGKVINNANDVKPGEQLTTTLASGKITSIVQ